VTNLFPTLPLSGWQATRDLLPGYARAAGRIHRSHVPAPKHFLSDMNIPLAAGEQALDCPEFGQQILRINANIDAA
jgi:hypothetical protein